MKNLKRIIALVAVFALALTTFASAASFTDVAEDSVYYRAVEQLHKIGIIDGYTDGTFKPEQTVNRAEMAKLIAAMQGYADSAAGKSATKFSDVPSTHWASGYIASATGTGIDGLPDGTFAPERNVKYEEAVKMIMATLGYTVIANAEGGYPMGYISAAIKEKVTEDVTGANIGSDASRGTIAQLIYNAIDTPLVEQVTWNKDGSGDYIKHDGSEYVVAGAVAVRDYKTLMTENLEIVKGEGVVRYNTFFGMDASASTDIEDAPVVGIKIVDGKKVYGDSEGKDYFKQGQTPVVLVADSDAMDYVGYAVDFYARQNEYDEWEILSILPSETFNKTLTFNLSDYDEVESIKTGVDANVIYYYKENASTSTKVTLQEYDGKTGAPAFDTMINYKAGLTKSTIKDELSALKKGLYGGEVTLIDNDKYPGYDAVIIEAAVSDVVDEVKRSVIALENGTAMPVGKKFKLDVEDEDRVIVLMKDGEEITIDQVAEDDVVSIVGQADGVYAVVEVMSNVIEGTISSTKSSTTSAGGKAYKIDGTWYDVATGATIVAVAGEGGSFYIDKYGKIAYFVEGGTFAGNYAYVLDTLLGTDDWGKDAFSLKLLTKDGIQVYTAATKFTYNEGSSSVTLEVDKGIKDKDSKDYSAIAQLENTTKDGTLDGQVIDFALSGGKVKKITLADYVRTGTPEANFKSGKTIKDQIFDAEDLSIGSIDCDEDTVVFYVDETTPENSYVGTLADIEDQLKVTGQAYEDKYVKTDANIIVLKNAITKVSASTGLAVIVDFESGSNEEEEDIYTLTMLYNGEEVTYSTNAEVYTTYENKITVGDVVKVKVTGNGLITAMDMVFDLAENVRGEGKELTKISGLYKYASKGGTLNTTAPADDKETFAAGYVTKYNKTSKKVLALVDNNNDKAHVAVDLSLVKADNVYVIDGTGRELDVFAGAAGDFDWDEELTVFDDKNDEDETNDTYLLAGKIFEDSSATAANYADIVLFRTYDGDVVDVVIIKGSTDYDIKSNI